MNTSIAECLYQIASTIDQYRTSYALVDLTQCGLYTEMDIPLWVDVNSEECIVFEKRVESIISRYLSTSGITIGELVVCFASDPAVQRMINNAQKNLYIV